MPFGPAGNPPGAPLLGGAFKPQVPMLRRVPPAVGGPIHLPTFVRSAPHEP